MAFTEREQIEELVHKLFVYTDQQDWQRLLTEVFADQVHFDMTSLGGGEPTLLPAQTICDQWQAGFEGIDSVNHLAGNLLVDIQWDKATIFAYATATHYKAAATQGNTRDFVGTYDLHAVKLPVGWRLDRFKYNLKYSLGNLELN